MENIRLRSMMLMEKHSWLALRIIASVARRRVSNGDAARLHTQTNCVACARQVAASIKGRALGRLLIGFCPQDKVVSGDSVCPADNDATGAGNVAAGPSRL